MDPVQVAELLDTTLVGSPVHTIYTIYTQHHSYIPLITPITHTPHRKLSYTPIYDSHSPLSYQSISSVIYANTPHVPAVVAAALCAPETLSAAGSS